MNILNIILNNYYNKDNEILEKIKECDEDDIVEFINVLILIDEKKDLIKKINELI